MVARIALLFLLSSAAVAAPGLAEDLAVVVHPTRDARLSVDQIAQIYLKQRRFWGDGELIVPVNRDSGSSARDSFVRMVFGANARQHVVYWNRQYFRGVLPPATLASDEAVKRFVSSEPLAIGYIRMSALDDSVKVLLRLHDPRAPRKRNEIPRLRPQLARGPAAGLARLYRRLQIGFF